MKKITFLVLVLVALFLVGCSAADVASHNLSTAADNFEVQRRIVFYNGITDTYMLSVEGRCALGNNDVAGELSVTCKINSNTYYKHFLGLSDNVTYFVEQLDPIDINDYHYRVIFRPAVIVPAIEVK
jgi:hypothetical protein